jgi:hypothetical protein
MNKKNKCVLCEKRTKENQSEFCSVCLQEAFTGVGQLQHKEVVRYAMTMILHKKLEKKHGNYTRTENELRRTEQRGIPHT